jgi:TPR repeat protein
VSVAAPYATLAPIFAADARKDYATELKLLRPLVDKGDVDAQFMLALMYDNGTGVAQDYKEAARLWGLAAAQGHASAQYNLGVMYDKGQGVVQDYKEAARLYGLAAAQGEALAQSNLGVMYQFGQGVAQDYVRAHMWFNLGAISGDKDNKAPANRDIVAAKMTPAQIAEAQAMARKCQASNFKKCD